MDKGTITHPRGREMNATPDTPPSQYESELVRANRYEGSVVGSLLLKPSLLSELGGLTSRHFTEGLPRVAMTAIERIVSSGGTADVNSVSAELGNKVPPGYLLDVSDGVMPESFSQYCRAVLEASRTRQLRAKYEVLGATPIDEWSSCLEEMSGLLKATSDDWRNLFHTREEIEQAKPLNFAIDGWLQCAGVTLIGGLSGHGKTLIMLSMTKALLSSEPLFGHSAFIVPEPSKRVLYLIPESAKDPFAARMASFKLTQFYGDRLFVRTLSSPGTLGLADSRLLTAAEGADVFLDTAVRFMSGSENDAENSRLFAEDLFRLLSAGARTVTGAHHAPKGFANADYMSLENILRGSGDIGAMLCTAWGVRQIDAERNRIWVENCKPRDFQPCQPFVLEGRPHIDQKGDFKLYATPGSAGQLADHVKNRAGRPETDDKASKVLRAAELRAAGKSLRESAEELGVSKSAVEKWLFQFDAAHKDQN